MNTSQDTQQNPKTLTDYLTEFDEKWTILGKAWKPLTITDPIDCYSTDGSTKMSITTEAHPTVEAMKDFLRSMYLEQQEGLLAWIKKESIKSVRAGVLGYDFVSRLEKKLEYEIAQAQRLSQLFSEKEEHSE